MTAYGPALPTPKPPVRAVTSFVAAYRRWFDEHPWQEDGLCAQTDPDSFFPEKGGSTREAKRVCAACPVRAMCLEFALATDQRFGVWGGLSERERRAIIRQRRAAARAAQVERALQGAAA